MNLDNYLQQIKILIGSDKTKFYHIGITDNFSGRRSQYRRLNEQNQLFIIDTEISGSKILKLEEALFKRLIQDKRNSFYKRYCKLKRDKKYQKSAGGRTIKEVEKIKQSYYLYIAVFTKD